MGRRLVTGGVFGTVAFKEVEMNGVGDIIDFLGLPGTKSFAVIADAQAIARSFELLGKSQRIGGKVEGLGRKHPSALMVFMVFTDNVVWHPGEDDFRASDANEAHHFFERLPVSPSFERMEDVASGSVGSVQKPRMGDSVRGQRVARLHLADVGQCF